MFVCLCGLLCWVLRKVHFMEGRVCLAFINYQSRFEIKAYQDRAGEQLNKCFWSKFTCDTRNYRNKVTMSQGKLTFFFAIMFNDKLLSVQKPRDWTKEYALKLTDGEESQQASPNHVISGLISLCSFLPDEEEGPFEGGSCDLLPDKVGQRLAYSHLPQKTQKRLESYFQVCGYLQGKSKIVDSLYLREGEERDQIVWLAEEKVLGERTGKGSGKRCF